MVRSSKRIESHTLLYLVRCSVPGIVGVLDIHPFQPECDVGVFVVRDVSRLLLLTSHEFSALVHVSYRKRSGRNSALVDTIVFLFVGYVFLDAFSNKDRDVFSSYKQASVSEVIVPHSRMGGVDPEGAKK